MVVWGVSVDPTILHTFLSALACTACTDIVYLKELERGVTISAMAKAMLRLKTLVFIFQDVTKQQMYDYAISR